MYRYHRYSYNYHEQDSSDDSSSYSSSSDEDEYQYQWTRPAGQERPDKGGLEVRYNESGYRQYWDETKNKWEFTHRRVAEKKVGRRLERNEEVHHINKDRQDNRASNLVVLDKDIHRELHRSPYHERNCCYRCGRTSHRVSECYATYNIYGDRLK